MLCWRWFFEVVVLLLQHFGLEKRPIAQLWGNMAAQPIDFPRGQAKSRWRSVDAHFHDLVPILQPPFFQRKAAD